MINEVHLWCNFKRSLSSYLEDLFMHFIIYLFYFVDPIFNSMQGEERPGNENPQAGGCGETI